MKLQVRFRFNKETGEVEELLLSDQSEQALSPAEHNQRHDRKASEIGRVLERNPLIHELRGGPLPSAESVENAPSQAQESDKTQRNRHKQ